MTLLNIIILTDIFIAPVVVDIGPISTVASKYYMNIPTLIQRIIAR
jgi:hypothetical protein